MNSLKGVIVGAGYFAGFQTEAWRRLPGAGIAAVVDLSLEKAREFAERYGIPGAYGSLEEAIRAERPDFVDISTRPEAHLPLVQIAAASGAHIICQKPMAPTWEQCLAMVEACDAAAVRLLIHENWRWQPWYREVKRQLDAGRLGWPLQISFVWRTGDGRGPLPYQVQPYFREMPRLLVYETLVHLLDTFRYLFGEIRTVSCQNRRVNPAIVGEDQSLIVLRFRDDRLGLIDGNRLSGSHPAPVAMGNLVVEGDAATLRVSPDGHLWLTAHGQSERRLPFDPPTSGYKGDSVFATQAHLLDCLASGRQSESDGRDYLKTVALVEACYESAETGKAVSPVL